MRRNDGDGSVTADGGVHGMSAMRCGAWSARRPTWGRERPTACRPDTLLAIVCIRSPSNSPFTEFDPCRGYFA
jgi:hypothetical protein